MNIEQAEKLTNELDRLLQAYGPLLEDCFIDELQKQTWNDFKINILAIADSEICFAQNIQRIEQDIENQRITDIG